MKVKRDKQKIASCNWQEDDEGIYETECGEMFEFTASGPDANGFVFCPYCGLELCEVIS